MRNPHSQCGSDRGCFVGTDVCDALLAIRRVRSEIDKLLGSDRVLCLVVAIETALADERYEVRQPSFSKQCLREPGLASGLHTSAAETGHRGVMRMRDLSRMHMCGLLCSKGRCTRHGLSSIHCWALLTPRNRRPCQQATTLSRKPTASSVCCNPCLSCTCRKRRGCAMSCAQCGPSAASRPRPRPRRHDIRADSPLTTVWPTITMMTQSA